MIGRTIGHYEILEKIGEGGMGEVYKARDTKLNRTVAIKVLPAEKVRDPARVARFIQEARAASSLNHPNIVAIYDILSQEDGECIIMEYVPGRSLSQLIARKELRQSEILKFGVQIAEALSAAHTAGIIHRDLKPSNIMVTERGLVKVLDFGLAKLTSGQSKTEGATLTSPRTEPGLVVGTPGYMSPEQVKGQELDRRTDVFNLGLILYEMLSGVRAFQGETSVEVMNAILKEEPPDLPERISLPLREVVSVCLEKNPADRFESARDVGFALRAVSTGTGITAAVPKLEAAPSRRPQTWVLFLALAAMTVLALILIARDVFRPAPLDLSSYHYTPFATDPDLEYSGNWSPDGKSIAYFKGRDPNNYLIVRRLSDPFPTTLSGPLEVCSDRPFWSRDGNQIYFIAQNRLWSIGVVGGQPQRKLPADVGLETADLSPDGQVLVIWRATEVDGATTQSVWISSPPGSSPRPYQPAPFEVKSATSPNYIRFSPDGSRIVFCGPSATGRTEFWLLDWPDGPRAKQSRIFQNRSFDSPPEFDWLPDSRHLVMTFEHGLWLADIKTGRFERFTTSESISLGSPSVSRDGRRIVYNTVEADFDIVEVPLNGSNPRPLLATARLEHSPSWALAADRMAFITNRLGEQEIWLRSARGEWERPVVAAKDFPEEKGTLFAWPSLSPDGKRLAFVRMGSQTGTTLWISSATGGQPMPVMAGTESDHSQLFVSPSWSPDGNSLACFGIAQGGPGLAIMRMSGQVTPEFLKIPPDMICFHSGPGWSPDGQWIAYTCPTEGGKIILVSPDGKTLRTLPSPVVLGRTFYAIAWSPDSSTLYVASSDAQETRLDAVDIRTKKARTVAAFKGPTWFQYPQAPSAFGSLAPDGKSFATTVLNAKSDLWILEGFPQPGRRRQ